MSENKQGGSKSVAKSPGELIREALIARNWTQADLAKILNRPLPTINEIIVGKRAIMPEMAIALGMAFGDAPEVWIQREAAYRLSLAKDTDGLLVRKRARLYEVAPIKEIQKRGWIRPTDDVIELEAELKRFLGVNDLEDEPELVVDFRKSTPYGSLTSAQKAWCARVKQLAKALKVGDFQEQKTAECEKELRKLAAYPQEARKIPNLLASHGVRFIIVEPLQGSKIDGAALWIDNRSPVIALSLRYDRIDNFWFGLGHEWSHIKHRDALSIDTDLFNEERTDESAKPPIECRADADSAAMLIPPDKLESFILRVSPMYSKERIIQFAHRVRIHPGIIVGELQRRNEIGYHANRDLLVKIKDAVTFAAVTDGWGHTLDEKVTQ